MTTYVLLGLSQLIGLAMIAMGAPGAWLQLAVLAGFGWWTDFSGVGVVPLVILLVLAVTGELIVLVVGRSEVAARSNRRVASASVAGGLAGALIGYMYPLLGMITGAFIGAWAGAAIGGWRVRAGAAGSGRMAPPITAAAMRATIGIAMAAFTLLVVIP